MVVGSVEVYHEQNPFRWYYSTYIRLLDDFLKGGHNMQTISKARSAGVIHIESGITCIVRATYLVCREVYT